MEPKVYKTTNSDRAEAIKKALEEGYTHILFLDEEEPEELPASSRNDLGAGK